MNYATIKKIFPELKNVSFDRMNKLKEAFTNSEEKFKVYLRGHSNELRLRVIRDILYLADDYKGISIPSTIDEFEEFLPNRDEYPGLLIGTFTDKKLAQNVCKHLNRGFCKTEILDENNQVVQYF